MHQAARRFIHRFVLRPLVRAVLRFEGADGDRLDRPGPAIVVANHNSHVDTAVLMAAFPTESIHRVRPMAAADYFLRNRLLAWFSKTIVGIVPIHRRGADEDPLAAASQALGKDTVLLVFPEGTRGRPGVFGDFKTGVARLALRHPDVPVVPVWLDGCERAMPRGARLPHRVACRATVGRPLFPRPSEPVPEFLSRLRAAMLALARDVEVAA